MNNTFEHRWRMSPGMTAAVIIYHGGCWDGFGAAMVARDALRRHVSDIAVIPAHYGMTPYDLPVKGADVYVLDYSFSPDQMEWISAQAERMVWIDHHATAIDAMVHETGGPRATDDWVTDLDRSGIRLAWDHFEGADLGVPWEVQYIEDRDLWHKALPDHDAVLMWIRSHEMTIEAWRQIRSTPLNVAAAEGKAMAAYHDRLVRNAAANAVDVRIGGQTMPLVSCSYDLGSDVCDLLIRERCIPVAAYWLLNGHGQYQYGFRSRSEFDCSSIAKQFGGGGHPQASGCQTAVLIHTRTDNHTTTTR